MVGLLGLVGCDPAEPVVPVSLVVTTTEDGGDAHPGDGVCEITPGVGDCSLRAALHEANATDAPVHVELPAGTYALTGAHGEDDGSADLDVDVASRVEVTAQAPGAVVDATGAGGGIETHRGALVLTRVSVIGSDGDGAVARSGSIIALHQSAVTGHADAGLVAHEGSGIELRHTTVSGNGTSGVVAHGTVDGAHATVTSNGGGGISGDGQVTWARSIVADQTDGADCTGPIVSTGHNIDSDGTCGLDADGDLTGDPLLGPLTGSPLPAHALGWGSPAIDAVGAECGDGEGDQWGSARPIGDGCDLGAIEMVGRSFLVDSEGDSVDVAPGDGVCADEFEACTLRAAIGESNAWGAPNTVEITSGLAIELTRGGLDDNQNVDGDLDVRGDLTIVGNGASVSAPSLLAEAEPYTWCPIPQGPGCNPNLWRVKYHLDRFITVHGVSLTVDGLTVTDVDARDEIFAVEGGSLDIADVVVDARAERALVRSSGDVTVSDSALVGAVPTLVQCTDMNTYTGCFGHGVESSAVDVLNGTAQVSTSTLGGWRAGVQLHGGTVGVSTSTVSGWDAGLRVGGGHATIESSTLIGDDHQGGYRGEAVVQTGGTVEVVSSTLHGESGIAQNSGSLSLLASTVDGREGPAVAYGGTVEARGSIVGSCSAPLTSSGYNLDSDGSCFDTNPADASGALFLADLADNGGPTATRLPASYSPAVDAIPLGAPGLCDGTLPSDQRGSPRPLGDGCDIGSVEGSSPHDDHFVVTTSSDLRGEQVGDGRCGSTCSLRAAIDEANAIPGQQTIRIDESVDRINLTLSGRDDDMNASGDLDITDDLVIHAPEGVIINGAGRDRVVHVHGATVVLDNVTITGGRVDDTGERGGGVLVSGGDVELRNAKVWGNTLTGAESFGGGIAVDSGSLSLTGSAVYQNSAGTSGAGGGVFVGGGDAQLLNSTISDNDAVVGSALAQQGGSIHARYTTLVGDGAGATVDSSADIAIEASIVAGLGSGAACGGPVVSEGHNVDTDGSCALNAEGDQAGVDPGLVGLAETGGGFPVHRVAVHGPVADVIPDGAAGLCDGTITSDQVGAPRPGTVPGCTPGAFEEARAVLVVDDSGDAPDADPGDGVCATAAGTCTLRAAIDVSNAQPGMDLVRIAPGIDPVVSIAGTDDDVNASGDLDITSSIRIEGGGATLDAAGLDRAIDVHGSGIEVQIDELHMTGGAGVAEGGGIRIRDGSVTVSALEIYGNEASSSTTSARGGGIAALGGTLSIDRSTVTDNVARSAPTSPRGGGIHSETDVVMRRSTIHANAASGTYGSSGGGLSATAGQVDLLAVTLTDNSSVFGRGLSAPGPATVSIGASLLDNEDRNCSGWVSSTGANLAVTDTCINSFEGRSALRDSGDRTGLDAALGPLADNGGPTRTRLPGAGSYAIDMVDSRGPGCNNGPRTDQIGQPRPLGDGCDAGAVEGASSDRPHLVLTVDDPGDSSDANPEDLICETTAGTCTFRAALRTAGNAPQPTTIIVQPGLDPIVNQSGPTYVLPHRGTLQGNGVVIDLNGYGGLDSGRGWSVIEDVTVTGATRDAIEQRGPGDLTLRRVTITGNQGVGLVATAKVLVESSTFDSNTSGSLSPAEQIHANEAADVRIVGSSLTGGAGNAFWLRPGARVQLHGTIVTSADTVCTSALASLGHNLISDSSCSLDGPGDQQGVDPMLAALGDNGGLTPTRLLLPGSPAIDVIPIGTAGLCDGTLAGDQRGVARPSGAACDVGATESG